MFLNPRASTGRGEEIFELFPLYSLHFDMIHVFAVPSLLWQFFPPTVISSLNLRGPSMDPKKGPYALFSRSSHFSAFRKISSSSIGLCRDLKSFELLYRPL